MSKRKITSVLELTPKAETFVIMNPANGDELEIELRPLTNEEINEISAKVKRPKPPIKGFKPIKDQWGQPIPEYDEDNPDYVKASNKANEDFVFLWLIESWNAEIPGDNVEAKLETLRKNLPNWVFMELQRTLQEVQGYRTSDVAFLKKKSQSPTTDTPS